jgi:XapX domain-containing protein
MRDVCKTLLGVAVAFGLGLVCRVFDIPSPAPPVLTGALLVLAMTLGYAATDRLMRRPSAQHDKCAGPSGVVKGDAP